jgi:FlaA1/EpsC-like NDP-sugar epimerase
MDRSLAPAARIGFTMAALMLNALVLIVAIAAAMAIEHAPDFYFEEGSVITVWSSLQIVTICAHCLWIFQLRRDSRRSTGRSHALWLLGAVGAGVLSIDEAAGLHETVDHQIHAFFNMPENPWTDRIDDVIVLGYGLIAMAVAYVCRAEFRVLRTARDIFIAAFALFSVMVLIDLLTNSYSITPRDDVQLARFESIRAWGVVLEDTFKLASEGVFVAALSVAAITFKRRALHDE